jgi:hypothetical protein
MRDRLKVLETVAAEAALHPILPATARAAIAELVALNRELVDQVESHEQRIENIGEAVAKMANHVYRVNK